mmetsp:Transcript_2597/g.8426  ORF Transcript_2597/g.8426 Transcript_2597/m.8426 type:complete len:289 (-) Transcript_2597:27-893(-)
MNQTRITRRDIGTPGPARAHATGHLARDDHVRFPMRSLGAGNVDRARPRLEQRVAAKQIIHALIDISLLAFDHPSRVVHVARRHHRRAIGAHHDWGFERARRALFNPGRARIAGAERILVAIARMLRRPPVACGDVQRVAFHERGGEPALTSLGARAEHRPERSRARGAARVHRNRVVGAIGAHVDAREARLRAIGRLSREEFIHARVRAGVVRRGRAARRRRGVGTGARTGARGRAESHEDVVRRGRRERVHGAIGRRRTAAIGESARRKRDASIGGAIVSRGASRR